MAEGRGELEVYNQWFAAADLDRCGAELGAAARAERTRSADCSNVALPSVREQSQLCTCDVRVLLWQMLVAKAQASCCAARHPQANCCQLFLPPGMAC